MKEVDGCRIALLVLLEPISSRVTRPASQLPSEVRVWVAVSGEFKINCIRRTGKRFSVSG